MNYEPVTIRNQTGDAGIESNVNAGQAGQEKASDHEYILLPLMLSNSPLSASTQSRDDKDADEVPDKGDDNVSQRNGQEKERGASNKEDDQHVQDFRAKLNSLLVQQKVRNKERLVAQGYTQEEGIDYDKIFAPVARIEAIRLFLAYASFMGFIVYQMDVKSVFLYGTIHKDHPKDQIIGDINSTTQTKRMIKISEEHAMASYIKKQRRTNHKDYQNCLFAYFLSQIEPKKVFAPVAMIEAIRLFLAYASFMGFIVYQMDVKSAFLYGTIEKEVYVCQPSGFEDPQFPDKVYKVEKALYGLYQAPRLNDEIFISQDKYVADIMKKFDFVTVKTASTPMEPNKALVKDEEADNVDVHLYRSMIGSLMYLTASRPDITFAVCACARFQVTPKVSHLHAVKRIFRYLKGQPKLGLWYPRDSPFDLEAFSDSDYAGASLDRKSTTGGCQFLRKRLISWQCKKQTIVANSTTEAEYVAAANCCGQVLWIQNQMLDYGFNFMNTKIYIDNESTICIVKNPKFHAKTKHIEIRHHFIRDSYEKRLIQVIKVHSDHNVADLLTKAFDVSRTCNIKQKCVMNQTPRQIKRGRDTKIPQSSGPPKKVGDEAVHKELGDRMERAATTASSLEAEQDSGNINRTQSMATLNEPSP
ncbi:putative reverse transcriptase, RNA-dependent DNA polymerase [Tanacetum coccineum]